MLGQWHRNIQKVDLETRAETAQITCAPRDLRKSNLHYQQHILTGFEWLMKH